jgi:hypothetical protein
MPVPPPIPVQAPARNGHYPLSSLPSHMDVDREEGEVSDTSQDHGLVHAPSAPSSKKRKLRASQLAHRTVSQPKTNSSPTSNILPQSQPSLQQKKEAVLPFIAALHQEGFAFDEFVREGFEESLLRQVYQELRIPVVSERPLPVQALPKEFTPADMSTESPAQPSPVASAKEVKPIVPVKQPAPVSRHDYLARLQAAKNKKVEAAPVKQQVLSDLPTASATPPSTAQRPAESLASLSAQTQTQSKPDTDQKSISQPTPAVSKQSQTTELIRKKMEALKATQRRLASKNNNNNASVALPKPALPSLSQTTSNAQPNPSSASSSISRVSVSSAPVQAAGAGMIPGLSMSFSKAKSQLDTRVHPAAASFSTTSTVASKSSTPQPTPTTSIPVTRKRPVASDLNEPQLAADHRPFKRPFGKSRQNSFDEAMIIQVSDDEESSDGDNEDMLNSAKPSLKAIGPQDDQRNKNIRDLPPLRDFPHRSAFNKTTGISTPPLGTPGTTSDAEELKRKEMEITSLNQRIMEYEKRKAALKAKAQLAQNQPQTPSQINTSPEKTSALPTPNASATPRSKKPTDRRTEIKAALTSRDADIVGQKAKILEMQRQVAEMQRQYEQDMENQQKLRDELESLDVNTDGMTRSEMEAKKQEIEELLETEVDDPTPRDSQHIAQATLPVDQQDETDVSMSEGDSNTSSDESVTALQSEAMVQSPRRLRDATTTSPGRARVLDNGLTDRANQQQQTWVDDSESSSDADSGSSMSESSDSENEEEEAAQLVSQESVNASVSSKSSPKEIEQLARSVSAESEHEEPEDKPVWLFVRCMPPTASKDDLRSFFGAFDV